MAGASLPERVAQIYYTYGLFCSSYPIVAITFVVSVVLICCFPLLNVPLPGNIPTVVNVPINTENGKQIIPECIGAKCPYNTSSQLDIILNETEKLPYIWAKDKPIFYVHQIIMKIGISPWNKNLKMWDAFRAPLQEVFRLLETIRNHEDSEIKSTLLHHCYQIGGINRKDSKVNKERLLPEYSCLLLSPANLWQQNLQSFSLDANIINTVYNNQKGKASIAEMAFGMQLRDTGIKRYPLRCRPRVLQYAITIFYEYPEQRFIQSLTKKLKEMYPLYQNSPQATVNEFTLIYYPGQFNYRELVPLMITFVGIFLYVYFSVRKIEFIKSKLSLAACAVLTIAGSLSMSMGICFYFGFSLSLQGKIFPYLVIIMGLENVLVLTKSVTSTDSRLDVKIRLAQGLSKEGWSITKNFLTEITIFTVSFFTFVPFIQEFSIFMIVSLISDYFIQMVFFATILGIDVRHMEYLQDKHNKLHLKEYFNANYALNWRINKFYNEEQNLSPHRMTKSKSHPRLNGLANSPTDVVANRNASPGILDNRVPKRIRLVNMWARTRLFQRAFMLWMLVWISIIVYNSGVVEYFVNNPEKSEGHVDTNKRHEKTETKESTYSFYNDGNDTQLVFPPLLDMSQADKTVVDTNETIMFKHSPHSRPWSRMSPTHWSAILAHYNESLAGRYAVILPPTLLSHRLSPELAVGVRNPDEKDPTPLRWQALAAALDPLDILPEFDLIDGKSQPHQWGKGSELPILPTTPMEILLLAILCIISVLVIAYMMVVLYRCVCSRHYAEWRASWYVPKDQKKSMSNQPSVQLVMEAVPLVVAGHSQEVECLGTDGEKIVSSCLQGNIKVWDSQNGEIITNIDRSSYFNPEKEELKKGTLEKVLEYFQAKPKNEYKHTLRKDLSIHLKELKFLSVRHESRKDRGLTKIPIAEISKYDFAKNFRDLYRCDATDDLLNCFDTLEDDKSLNNDTNLSNEERELMDNGNNVDIYENSTENRLRNRINNKFVFNENLMCGLKDSESDVRRESSLDWKSKATEASPVWSMDFCNDLITLGCADGRVEFWEADFGNLLCVWWSIEARVGQCSSAGVTHVRVLFGGKRVAVATLAGHLSLLRLDVYNSTSGAQVDWQFCNAHRRTHKRTGSAGSIRTPYGMDDESNRARMSFSYESEPPDAAEEIVCVRVAHCRPHQQPITEMHSKGGRIVTGGQDHVLKVFTSAYLTPLFTLHGHCGPITSCFIDHVTPTIAGSGSQDGLLCVWDLHTGACLYTTQAHDGAVTSLAYTPSYVVSAGADERLCIWDRFQGHMLNSIHIGLSYMSRMLPLTHTLLVIGDRNGLTAYDLSSGDIIRRVLLGPSDGCIFVRQILPLKDAIVCDYANQLRIVRFPLISKLEDVKNE